MRDGDGVTVCGIRVLGCPVSHCGRPIERVCLFVLEVGWAWTFLSLIQAEREAF